MLNKAILIGIIKRKELQYKTKSDGSVVPICDLELLVEEQQNTNLLKITFFYDKAEEIAEKTPLNSLIYVECKLKGAKDKYYSLELWGIRYKIITMGVENENTDI